MNMTKFVFPLAVLLLAGQSLHAVGPDRRPKFDKSSYRGTLWTQVNPWWHPNKPRTGCPLGGPNYARKVYPDDPVAYWREAMAECKAKGMTGWQFELPVSAPGYGVTLKEAIKAAEELGDFKLALFLGVFRGAVGNSVEGAIKALFTQFDMFADEYRNSDVFFRVDGAPVLSIYSSWDFSPDEWLQIQEAFEARYGHSIWLANLWWGTYVPSTKQEELRKWMPVFDGCTAYANWASQTELYRLVGEVMHNEFPDKIFEGTVTNTYSVHYLHSGTFTYVARKYLKSWDSMMECRPDSIVMTNLFDHWENSIILPCYEREDFLLRYGELMMARLFDKPFQRRQAPEVVVTSYIDMVAGLRELLFEVISLPVDTSETAYTYTLELLDETGQPIHAFPAQEIKLDDLDTKEFTIGSAAFAGRLLTPRLKATWHGEEQRPLLLPPLWVDPALRGSLMFWARSTANALHSKSGSHDWTLNGQPAGSVVDWRQTMGKAFAEANLEPLDQEVTRVRVMRNGEEFFSEKRKNLNHIFQLDLPCPRLNDDYYWLEMECANGNRFNTLPIWVTTRKDEAKVETVIASGSGKEICKISLPPGRVPAFDYPCEINNGGKLMDVGGLLHNGNYIEGAVGDPFGSLRRTGYRHYVNDMDTLPRPGLFQKDADGKGFIRLDADKKAFFMLAGGTAFPYSYTYEISVRPLETGRPMGILGTVLGPLNLFLDAEGRMVASRETGFEHTEPPSEHKTVTVSSLKPLEKGKWSRIAVTYDCQTLKLYVDGELQGEVASGLDAEHATLNYVSVGCRLRFLQEPYDFFNGDIRNLRLTGRPLAPSEFR